MYNFYFGFRAAPFSVSPDEQVAQLHPSYQDTSRGLFSAIREHFAFVVFTGEAGVGKTTVVQQVQKKMAKQFVTCYVATCPASLEELLASPCIAVQTIRENTTSSTLGSVLKICRQTRETVLLFLDNAHLLSQEILECLRVLSDLRTPTAPLLSIILVGRSELKTKLQQAEFGCLWGHIDVHLQMHPLDEEEVSAFIHARLHAVGCNRVDLFTPEAIHQIALYSRGLPGRIHLLCDNALLAAFMAGQSMISAGLVEHIAHELFCEHAEHTPISPAIEQYPTTPLSVTIAAVENPTPLCPDTRLAVTPHSQSRQFILVGLAAVLLVFTFLRLQPSFYIADFLSEPSRQTATSLSAEDGLQAPLTSSSSLLQALPTNKQASYSTSSEESTHEASLVTAARTPPAQSLPSHLLPAAPTSRAALLVRTSAYPYDRRKENKPDAFVKFISAQQKKEAHTALLERGIEANAAALLTSIENGDVALATLLLQAGVSANVKDKQEWTALMLAARDGQRDLVQLLLACGGTVDTRNKLGATALMLAVMNNHPAIVQALLAQGAKVNAQNRQGWTALTYAAWKGHQPIVELLLQAGANTGVKDKNGWTASMYAKWQNDTPPDQPWITGLTTALWGQNSEPFDSASGKEYASIATRLEQAPALSK